MKIKIIYKINPLKNDVDLLLILAINLITLSHSEILIKASVSKVKKAIFLWY